MPKIKVLKGFKHSDNGHKVSHYDAGLEVEVSQACVASCMEMGSCELLDGAINAPSDDETGDKLTKEDLDEKRVELYDTCVEMGLKPNKNTGIAKLEGYILAEEDRIAREAEANGEGETEGETE